MNARAWGWWSAAGAGGLGPGGGVWGGVLCHSGGERWLQKEGKATALWSTSRRHKASIWPMRPQMARGEGTSCSRCQAGSLRTGSSSWQTSHHEEWEGHPLDQLGTKHYYNPSAPQGCRGTRSRCCWCCTARPKTRWQQCMPQVQAWGLMVGGILQTDDSMLGTLIYPVGFWRNRIKYIKQSSAILQ